MEIVDNTDGWLMEEWWRERATGLERSGTFK